MQGVRRAPINTYICDNIFIFKLIKNKTSQSRIILMCLLAVPLFAAIGVTGISDHAANAQITPAQQQALKSLVATGYTNSYLLKWHVGERKAGRTARSCRRR